MSDNSRSICTVLATSDLHGHIGPTDYRSKEKAELGLARLASLIKQERGRNPELLLVDNGDLLQGSPLTYYFARENREALHPAITALNHMRYDAFIPGNHEFNYGPELLLKAQRESDFPWLSANIADAVTGGPFFGKPYLVKQFECGVKAVIVGVTTHYIPNWEHPAHIEGLSFDDALECLKRWVTRIREIERPDVLIAAYHGGFERILETGEAGEPYTGENQAYAICEQVAGIDGLITGHQHRTLACKVNGVPIVQPSYNGQALGKLQFELEQTVDGWRIVKGSAEVLKPEPSDEADRELLAAIQDAEEETQRWLDRPIGRTEGDLTVTSPFELRKADHPFIELINRVQMEASGAPISAAALLQEQTKGFGPEISVRDVLANFMYPNTLVVLCLSGKDIKDALEQTAAYFIIGGDNGELTVNPRYEAPKVQHFNYDMWEGINYELHASEPEGSRIKGLMVQGEPLDPAGSYEVVLNNYRAAGGGDYHMFKGKPVVREIQIDMSELLIRYIMDRGVINASCDHNWRVVTP